jgi:AraC-like DNA-binding protein
MVRLGAWSSVLLLLALQALVLAILLWRAGGNRRANRALAGLLLVIAGLLTPYILGYAGAYDAAPWLTNAPFAVPLAVGPLLYAHVVALARGQGIARRHWIAPALQFGWQAALFPLPTAAKWRIDAAVIEPVVAPLSDAALLVSMVGYGVAAWRCLGTYRSWLEGQRRVERPARRIRLMILILVPLVAVRAAYSLFELAVRPVTYFDMFAYYLLLGATALGLGLAGWRQADSPAPAARDEEEARAERGRRWLERARDEGWTRDPELTLDALARRLGTNRADLSRALAPHGGFAAAVGRIRAEAVAEAMRGGEGGDLLALALAAGFGSKASFNRAFRARFGTSPSKWRGGADSREAAMPTD